MISAYLNHDFRTGVKTFISRALVPLSIIKFRIAELRYKRVYGCRKKRLNTATFFNNHYKDGRSKAFEIRQEIYQNRRFDKFLRFPSKSPI